MFRNSVSYLGVLILLGPASMQLVCGEEQKEQTTQQVQADSVSIESVAADPAKFVDQSVRLTGKLENEGENYFSDLRVVLRDEEGNHVYVQPWLPVSTPPLPPGFKGKRPQVLSQLLGKQVALRGVVSRGSMKKVGDVYLLQVKSAEILP